MNTLDTKNKLDTKYIINLDLIKDVENGVMNFALSDVETSDFFVSIYNNGNLLFNKDYMVTVYIVKPNGNFRSIELTPKVNLKKYYCNLTGDLINIPGEYVCQITAVNNKTKEIKASRSKFKYFVNSDIASEQEGSIDTEEKENILTEILNRILLLESKNKEQDNEIYLLNCKTLGFQEVQVDLNTGQLVDPNTGLILDDISFCSHTELYDHDVDNMLKDIFK